MSGYFPVNFFKTAENISNQALNYDIPTEKSDFNLFIKNSNNKETISLSDMDEFLINECLQEAHDEIDDELEDESAAKVEKNLSSQVTGEVNGYIDEKFEQGQRGDCALYSTVYALALTKEGSDSIKKSISETADGYVVTFSGTGESYNITKQELENANSSDNYGSGDRDMVLLEVAMEKAFAQSSEPRLKELVTNYGESNADPSDVLSGVNPKAVTYLLMGQEGSINDTFVLTESNNPASTSFNIKYNQTYTAKDALGNDINLNGNHTYKFDKTIQNNIITINDLTTGEELNIDYTDFMENIYKLEAEQDKTAADNAFQSIESGNQNTVMIVWINGNKSVPIGTKMDGSPDNMVSDHAYAVYKVEGDDVYLSNPWEPDNLLKVSRQELQSNSNFRSYTLQS